MNLTAVSEEGVKYKTGWQLGISLVLSGLGKKNN